jgi:hypothetical protein
MKIRLIMLICVLFLFYFVGCPGEDQPEVTLSVVDCPVELLEINPVVTVTGGSRHWTVSVSVAVTCDDVPVNGAQIKIKYPWLPAFIITTDEEGKKKVNRRSQQDPKPTGTVTVTIKGSDGEKPVPVSY